MQGVQEQRSPGTRTRGAHGGGGGPEHGGERGEARDEGEQGRGSGVLSTGVWAQGVGSEGVRIAEGLGHRGDQRTRSPFPPPLERKLPFHPFFSAAPGGSLSWTPFCLPTIRPFKGQHLAQLKLCLF